MSRPEEYKADRSRWASEGRWHNEPQDRADWEHDGMTCLALRHPTSGHWCGYVGVKPGHPWHGQNYNNIECEVHGGLTYSDECTGRICHTPKPGEPEHLWWLGFDCAHCDDVQPCMGAYRDHYATYKDLDYVRHQTESLAVQAKAAR